jgi:diaminopimelate decarboxylase
MATRTIEATLDTFSVDSGSEITYLGPTAAGNKGDAVRGFRVNPGGTGDIKVTLDRTEGVNTIQIFQEDAFGTGNAPTGYKKFFDIAKAGKGKGAVGVTVTNAAKNYVVLLNLDGYSEVSYNGSVVVP